MRLKNGKQQLNAVLRERLKLRESFCHLDASRFKGLKKEREKGKKERRKEKHCPAVLKKGELEKTIAQ